VGVVIRETLFSIIRVHINIVHDYGPRAHGSVIVGQQPGRKKLDNLCFDNVAGSV
jgi:hypothetical protein